MWRQAFEIVGVLVAIFKKIKYCEIHLKFAVSEIPGKMRKLHPLLLLLLPSIRNSRFCKLARYDVTLISSVQFGLQPLPSHSNSNPKKHQNQPAGMLNSNSGFYMVRRAAAASPQKYVNIFLSTRQILRPPRFIGFFFFFLDMAAEAQVSSSGRKDKWRHGVSDSF